MSYAIHPDHDWFEYAAMVEPGSVSAAGSVPAKVCPLESGVCSRPLGDGFSGAVEDAAAAGRGAADRMDK